MELTTIGKTHKPKGLDGYISLIIQDAYLPDLKKLEVLFIKTSSQPLPFFVDDLQTGSLPSVKLEDVNSREAAKKLSSKEVLARTSDLSEVILEIPSDLVYHFLIGFTMKDQELGLLGKIKEVLEFPQQEMAVLDYKGQDVFIPLNEAFIQKIDRKIQEVLVELPDGLLEL